MTQAKDKPPQIEKILDLLFDGEWHYNTELNPISYRYGDRLHKFARKHGYEHTDDLFENEQVDKGLFRYRIRPEMLVRVKNLARGGEQVSQPKPQPVGRCYHTERLYGDEGQRRLF